MGAPLALKVAMAAAHVGDDEVLQRAQEWLVAKNREARGKLDPRAEGSPDDRFIEHLFEGADGRLPAEILVDV